MGKTARRLAGSTLGGVTPRQRQPWLAAQPGSTAHPPSPNLGRVRKGAELPTSGKEELDDRHRGQFGFGDVPQIDVVLRDRKDLPAAGGGETLIVAIAPAIFNATGSRLRSMPLVPQGVVKS